MSASVPSFQQTGPANPVITWLKWLGIAAVLFAIVAGIVIHFTYHATFADATLTHTTLYPAHTVTLEPSPMHDVGHDEMYVLPMVSLHDNLTLPISLEGITATVITADDQQFDCNAAYPDELARVYAFYPALAANGNNLLLRGTTVAHNTTAQGLVLVHFPLSQDEWIKRKSAYLTLTFYYQPPIIVPIKAYE